MENAGVAQSVEQLICNQPVVGSNPITSSIFLSPTWGALLLGAVIGFEPTTK